MDKEQLKSLRDSGVMLQKDRQHFVIRLGIVGGTASPGLLRNIADIADTYGDGSVHLTTRQSVEIQNIPLADIDAALKKVGEYGMPRVKGGAVVRNAVACPGDPVCRCSAGDTQNLALMVKNKLGSFAGLPAKAKVAVAGCRNSCAKPQENDIGIMSTAGGYRIFVGGKIGRNPKLGIGIDRTFKDSAQVLEAMEKVLVWFRDNAVQGERLGDAIDRVGKEHMTKLLGAV